MKTALVEREQSGVLDRWQIGRVHPFPPQLPKTWELLRLIEVATLESGHTPSRHFPAYWKGDIPWISLHDTDGLDGPEIFDTSHTIGELGLANSSARLLPKGTVVFSRTATIGKATVMGRSMATSQDFANYVCGNRVHNYFLVHLFRFLAPEWKRLKAGSTLNTIYMPVFRDLQVLLPPIEEQKAIAAALSDVDALLGALDRLIAKKRDLKQAVMQQLLTGQTRLPGFSGKWGTKCFSDVLTRINAKVYQIQTTDYQLTGSLPIVDQGQEFIAGFSDRIDKRFRCPTGGVIVFGDHTCIVKYVDFDFVVGADGTQILSAKAGHSARFQALHLEYKGIAPTGYNRHFKFVKERDFAAPSLPEQDAIAVVLFDMKAELITLEQRRDKTRLLKQGMMQELLTGRTRLV